MLSETIIYIYIYIYERETSVCMCYTITVKQKTYIYIYISTGIHIIHTGIQQLSRFIFNYAHFPKPGILFRSPECLKLLTRNHYKNISSWTPLQRLFIPHKFWEDLSHQQEVKNWLKLWMPSQNAVIIVEWLSILFLYGYNALFQWVLL